MYNNLIYPIFSLMEPANNIKGIIKKDGNVVNSSTSSSVAPGNNVRSLSEIGEIAKPGNDVSAETDQIPNNAQIEIIPFPVCIFMTIIFKSLIGNKYHTQNVATHKKIQIDELLVHRACFINTS